MRKLIAVVGLVACGGGEDTSSPATCEGGGDPQVEIGQGNTNFIPWAEGDAVPVEQSGNYGFWTTLRTHGLDTREPMTTFLRFSLGADTETTDVGATVTYLCQDDGTGNATVFATLGDDFQTPDAVAALDGEALQLSATLTDTSGETVSAEIGLVLFAP